MNFKSWIRPIIKPLARLGFNVIKKHVPSVACRIDSRISQRRVDFETYFKNHPDAVSRFKDGMDTVSCELLDRSLARLAGTPTPDQATYYLIDYDALLTDNERNDCQKWEKMISGIRRQYPVFPEKSISSTDFFYHYGLTFLPNTVTDKLRGGVFLDCGAYDGTTSVMMQKFQPEKIYAFEISVNSGERYQKNLAACGISSDKAILVPVGVGDENTSFMIHDDANAGTDLASSGSTEIKTVTLDSYVKENHIENIRWIKADVEGFAINMVKGATETLRIHRPLLTLGVYHTPEELLEIKPYLESLNLGYRFLLRKITCTKCYMICDELCLIAIPESY